MARLVAWSLALVPVLTLTACSQQPPAPKASQVNLYERAAQLARDPAFQTKMESAATRMDQMRWMVGEWRTEVTVFATKTAPETHSTETTVFTQHGDSVIADERLSTIIGFDPFVGRWLATGIELPAAPGATAYGDWDGRRMVLEVPARVFGETFRLRQTLTKLSRDEFEVFNEQQIGERYIPVDRYRYRRLPPS